MLKSSLMATLLWQVTSLNAPESSHFDAKTNAIYVSNIGGNPTDKDGNGTITKISIDGKVLVQEWAKGLNAPKGITVHKDSLWVSDIDRVAKISINDPSKIEFIDIKDAKFLNDVAVDSRGNVYVSDMVANRIHKITTGNKVEVFSEGRDLESPNGLLVSPPYLVVASWGPEMGPDFSTKSPGSVYLIDLNKRAKHTIIPAEGNLDGLEVLPQSLGGGYVYSDWVTGKVYTNQKQQNGRLLLEGLQGAADIGFVPSKKILLVPEMKANRLSAYQISMPN
jgi:sugar lactone lactonase YvrE